MSRSTVETIMGAVVLLAAGLFGHYAWEGSNMKPVDGYKVKALFSNATGISTGSDVRVGGIKIGVVDSLALDPKSYRAEVTMSIRKDAKLPTDSSAAVVGEGLLGGKFVAIEPGGDEEMLKDGGKITITQSAVNLEEMIGKFMFSGGGVGKDGKETPAEGNGNEPSVTPSIN